MKLLGKCLLTLLILFSFSFLLKSPAIAATPIFSDNFDDDLSQWTLTIQPGDSIDLSTEQVISGKSVKFINQSKNYMEMRHNLKDSSGNFLLDESKISQFGGAVFSAWFYDDLLDHVIVVSSDGNESGNQTALGINGNITTANYFFRYNDVSHMYDSKIPRTLGWHLAELITTPQGTFLKIDNKFIKDSINSGNLALNTTQKNISHVRVAVAWGRNTGTFYIDNLKVTVPETNPDTVLGNLLDSYVQLYGSVDFTDLMANLGPNDIPNCRLHGNDVRALLNFTQLLAFKSKQSNNNALYQHALTVYRQVLTNAKWGLIDPWAISTPSYKLLESSSYFWKDLTQAEKDSIYSITKQNTAIVDSKTPDNRYINDTAAEENAWNAVYYSLASQFYPNDPQEKHWEDRAKCYAYHSITTSTDDPYCGIKTQTVYDNFDLSNHGITPNPVYTGGTLMGLAEAIGYYRINSLPTPNEFLHNFNNLGNRWMQLTDQFTLTYPNFGGDWSGVQDTAYGQSNGLVSLRSYVPSQGLDFSTLMKKRSLFFPNAISELPYPPIAAKISDFNGCVKTGDSYRFFLDSHVLSQTLLAKLWVDPSVAPKFPNQILVGDVNGDGKVDLLDLARIVNARTSANIDPYTGPEDVNGDGKLDTLDLTTFLGQYTHL